MNNNIQSIIDLLPEKITVNEAFTLLRAIQHNCGDIAIKCVTVDDIIDSTFSFSLFALIDEGDYERAKQAARDSWEFKNFAVMSDNDWEQFALALPLAFCEEMEERYADKKEG
jgi:hypothetical protein